MMGACRDCESLSLMIDVSSGFRIIDLQAENLLSIIRLTKSSALDEAFFSHLLRFSEFNSVSLFRRCVEIWGSDAGRTVFFEILESFVALAEDKKFLWQIINVLLKITESKDFLGIREQVDPDILDRVAELIELNGR